MSQEWLDEAELSTKIVKLPDHVRRINCNIMGIYGEFCYEPSLGINIIHKSLILDKSSQEHLSQSRILLELPSGQILDCEGVLKNIPIVINGLRISLDFHIFDLPGLSPHLTFIGRSIIKIIENVLGSLALELAIGKDYISVWITPSTQVESKPSSHPKEEVMPISLVDWNQPWFKEARLWSMGIHEELTLEFEKENHANEHGGFILEHSQDPCSFENSPKSPLCPLCTNERHTHPSLSTHKCFKRMVVDAFVYHKF